MDSLDRETNNFLGRYRRFVVRHYGKRCEVFSPGCPCCDAWQSYYAAAKQFDFTGEVLDKDAANWLANPETEA